MSVKTQRMGLVLRVLPLLPAITGCATFTHGRTQHVPVATVPAGAAVEVDGEAWQTPCTLELKRKHGHTLVISMEGYQTEIRKIAAVPTRAILGNIWLGGLVGMLVDAITGANNKLVPESIEIELTRAEAEPQPGVSAADGGRAIDDRRLTGAPQRP